MTGGDFTVQRLEEMEAVFNGAFRLVGAELGVASFGAPYTRPEMFSKSA